MKVVFVTTFAKDHIELYGKLFLNSFKKNCDYSLLIFAEDFDQTVLETDSLINFYSNIPEQLNFKNKVNELVPNLLAKPQNRLKKALRWSYKSFVIWYALKNIDADYIVWIDADVETIDKVPSKLIEDLCKRKLMMCYPQRIDGELHIESGFIIFNKQHALINNVIDHYYLGYHDQEVLNLNKPWDGFWLGKLIESDQDINRASELCSPPFRNINKYFRHNVGKDKFRDTGLNKFSGRF